MQQAADMYIGIPASVISKKPVFKNIPATYPGAATT